MPEPSYTGPVESRSVTGVLELHAKGYGFLRDNTRNYARNTSDAYVSAELIGRYRLREGVLIAGTAEGPPSGQGPRLTAIETIEGLPPEEYATIKNFDDLSPIDPHDHIRLEIGAEPLTMRIMDLFTPIGKGQRGLIVAPPRTGKTIPLQKIANAITANAPEAVLIVLLWHTSA